jgi:hypothetical protein
VRFHGGEARARLEVRGKSKASVRVRTTAFPEDVTANDGSVPESDPSNNIFAVPPVSESP